MKLLKIDKELRIVDGDIEVSETLDNEIYRLGFNQKAGEFYLKKDEDTCFALPKKMYGDVESISNRILKKYNSTNINLGCLLNGEKGSGKSLTAKVVCNKAELPIIIVDNSDYDIPMSAFLNRLNQPFILYIDEFEKIYPRPADQLEFLSLMDGTFNSNILFLLTSNSSSGVSNYLVNRPSRIYYKIDYGSLNTETIKEVSLDSLDNPDKYYLIQSLAPIIGSVNFDMLSSIISEINLFPEIVDHNEIMKYLNIVPEDCSYEITVRDKDKRFLTTLVYSNPLKGIHINECWWNTATGDLLRDSDGDNIYLYLRKNVEDYTDLNISNDKISFNVDGYSVECIRKEKKQFVY